MFFPLCLVSVVLLEISELVPEAEALWQQNAELRTLLQQFFASQVCVFVCHVVFQIFIEGKCLFTAPAAVQKTVATGLDVVCEIAVFLSQQWI